MKRSCLTLFSFVLPLLLSLSLEGCGSAQPTPTAPPVPVVTVSQPIEREIIDYYTFTGRTAAIESVDIRARVSGYLDKIAFREGVEVKKGDLLFEIDPRPYKAALAQAKGNVASAEARLKRQDADLARAQQLVGTRAISREEYDQYVGDRAETAASIEALRAAAERAALDVDFTSVTAPVAGRMDRALVTVGNLVSADTTLLTTLVSLDPIYAYFDVDEAAMLRYQELIREKKVQSAREAKVLVYLGLANEQGYPHEGVIDFVGNRLDPGTGTLRVRGIFPNKERILSPGLFARVRLPYSQPHKALVVSERALGADQRGQFLLVVDSENVVEYRPVTTGMSEDGFVVIKQGLKADDWVVVRGVQLARPGSQVDPQRAKTAQASDGAAPP